MATPTPPLSSVLAAPGPLPLLFSLTLKGILESVVTPRRWGNSWMEAQRILSRRGTVPWITKEPLQGIF